MRLAQAFVKKGSVGKGLSTRFDWRGLGFQVGVCFNSIPSNVSFLYGPLDAEYTPKERKKAERRKKQTQEEESEGEEEQPEEVDQTGKKKSDGNDELFAQWREQNNELYNEVRYTREAVLDSENIDLIASKAAREAEKIVQVSFNVCLYMFVIFFHMTHNIYSHSPSLSLVAKYNMM